jgi:hypothetical protein
MTYTELAEAGFSGKSIHALASRGVLLRVRRGAYARADLAHHVQGSVQLRERTLAIAAAVAVTGPDAAASHHDAALLHGIDLLDRPPPASIAVSRPGGHDSHPSGLADSADSGDVASAQSGHYSQGRPGDVGGQDGSRSARTTTFRAGVVAADSALYRGKTTSAELAAVVGSCSRWPGIDTARRVVGFSTELAESAFESIARVTFDEHGLPPPELQVWVGEDRPIARVDSLWSQHRTIAEADGALKYADPDRARQQLYRDAELRDAGFEVVHFSWRELTVNPAQVIGWIIAAFARASTVRTAG